MTNAHVFDFIRDVTPFARQVENVYGIPIEVSIAVSALETGWGRHVKGNSYFGVKGAGQVFTTHEYIEGERITLQDEFRSYSSPLESWMDFGKLIGLHPRYQMAMEFTDQPEQMVREIHQAGYATDPEWASKVVSIMRRWDLSSGSFPDVPQGHWAEEAIRQVMQKGIMGGFPDGEFKPSNYVTRAEMAVILSRLVEKGEE